MTTLPAVSGPAILHTAGFDEDARGETREHGERFIRETWYELHDLIV